MRLSQILSLVALNARPLPVALRVAKASRAERGSVTTSVTDVSRRPAQRDVTDSALIRALSPSAGHEVGECARSAERLAQLWLSRQGTLTARGGCHA